MMVEIHRLALAEIDAAVDWYDERQSGLGAELEDEIDRVLTRISQLPRSAPQWQHRLDHHVAVIARFPFTLPYRISGDMIVVFALAHMSRRPGYWRARR